MLAIYLDSLPIDTDPTEPPNWDIVFGNGDSRNVDGDWNTCSIDDPRHMVWDRYVINEQLNDPSEAILYITCFRGLRRFDMYSRKLTTIPVDTLLDQQKYPVPTTGSNPMAIDVTQGGVIIFSCVESMRLIAVDPYTNLIRPLSLYDRKAHSGTPILNLENDKRALVHTTLGRMCSLQVFDEDRALLVSDDAGRLKCMTLPLTLSDLFNPPANMPIHYSLSETA